MPPATSRLLRRLPIVVIVLAALAGALFLRDALSLSALARNQDRLLAYRDAHYPLAALAFVAAYALLVALSLPGALVATLTGGFLFGVFPGVVLNVTAATLGATAIFLAARAGIGTDIARRLDQSGGATRRFRDGLRRNEWSFLFLIRLVPVVPFALANLLPALLGVGLGRFALTTALGIVPGALIYTWLGAGLGMLFARGETPDLGVILEPRFLLPLLALAALSFLPVLVRRRA
ncbi:TVP38/TMEM64 family protein [Acidimangrovimonas sediminis]|uniref:TVP38/TMEM64 family protein n=1 Tax=Acidimangrovimonas sediminis TaxID=2056283 RepID=UPI000C7FF27B|nr:VTT domain-containing protein [Acidimangrovimonas sediminis]